MQVTTYVPGEVLVKTKPSLFKTSQELVEDLGAEVLDRFDSDDLFQSADGEVLHLKLAEGQTTEAALKKLAQDPRVELAAPNTVYQRSGPVSQSEVPAENVPNDLAPALWGLHNVGQDGGTPDADIDAPEAWTINRGLRSGGPIIAVLDTGQDLTHPDLQSNLWTNPGEIPGDGIDNDGNGVIDDVHGYNAVLNNGDPTAGHPHGTHCAGTIAADGNNGEGIVGVNWEAQVMPVKIFPDDGEATTAATILRAVEYADKMGARVTSNSWTGAGFNPLVQEALADSPALHIFAAGNESRDNDLTPSYPASFNLDNQIVVAASDRNDKLANFSCYGDQSVDLSAPGVEILSTVNGGGYASWAGTSMATPHVAGVAGLVASAYPEASNQEIKDRILYGTDRVDDLKGKVRSEGRLNAARAVANDRLPPAAPIDLRAGASFDTIQSVFSLTGDDGWCGEASAYQVKIGSQPITEDNYDELPVAVEHRAGEVGATVADRFPVMPSSEAQTMHVGVKVIDKVGNRSKLVSTEVTVRPARVAFEHSAETDEGWQVSGGWSRENGAWKATGGESTLTSPVFDLTDHGDSTVYLEARHNLERHYEFVQLEVREEGSDRWRRLTELSGDSKGAQVHTLPMHEFDQKRVQLRFTYEGEGSGDFEFSRLAVTGYSIGTQEP